MRSWVSDFEEHIEGFLLCDCSLSATSYIRVCPFTKLHMLQDKYLLNSPFYLCCQDNRGCVSVKGLTVRLACNEEESVAIAWAGHNAPHALIPVSSSTYL